MIVLRFPRFALWFTGEVLVCVARVLRDVVTPGSRATPRVVRLALRGDGAHAAALGALITLTPGTLTLGVLPDGGLLVHSMYHGDEAAARDDLRDMEARWLAAKGVAS